jgi:hypothetical protein
LNPFQSKQQLLVYQMHHQTFQAHSSIGLLI